MAISPKEVMNRLTEEDTKDLARLEEKIDKALLKDFDGEKMYYATSLLENANKRVIDKLLDKYRQAGWVVTYQCDQREGNYLEFRMLKHGSGGCTSWRGD